MPITQILLTAASSGGGGGPTPSGLYPPTLTAGSGSILFGTNLSSNSIIVSDNQNCWTMGTGDFTIEWYQWMLSTSSSVCRPFSIGNWGNAQLALSLENGTAYFWAENSGGANNQVFNFSYNTADVLDDWVHVAISKENGWTRIFFNGQLVYNTNAYYNIVTENPLIIGNEPAMDAGFSGYIKDFRVIKGLSVYNTNFIPPQEPLTVTAETKLLLSVNDSGTAFEDSSGFHSALNIATSGANYADVGPYALTLLVDANDINSFDFNVSTTNWNDLSSQDHDVTVTNMSWATGAYNAANFELNGYGVANSGTITPQDGITPRISLSFWAIINTAGQFQHVAGYRGGNKFHVLLLNNDTNLECRIETTTGYYDINPNITSTLGVIAHYAFVANGDRIDFYVNGQAVGGTTPIEGNFDGTLGDFGLARNAAGFQATSLLVGYARVDNRARSPREILREYNATKSVYGY